MDRRNSQALTLNWLRVRSRGIAVLALVAMAFQAAITFGHSHGIDRGGLSKSVSALKFQSASASAVVSETARIADWPSRGDDEQVCPVCLIGALIAAAITTSPPLLPLPAAYALLGPPLVVQAHSDGVGVAFFWSRGPPLS